VFDRIGRSIELTKSSLRILRADKELLLFPFVSGLVLLLVTISFALPFLFVGGMFDAQTGQVSPVAIVIAFVFYLVSYTVTFFFQTALVGATMIRLDGGDPTLGDGFRIAFSRLPQIIGYALIAATVGVILRMIAERAGIVGQIIVGIVGFAWNVATYLVVPVLAVERVGPIEAVKRSGSLLRQTWGEQIVGNFGIGLVFGVLSLLVMLIGIGIAVLLINVSLALVAAAVVAMVIVLVLIGLVGSAVSGIYTASLYRYATKGEAGAMYRPETLAGAFRRR
jgi:hypothetical protein